ncbi:MAG TPA: molybdenum cofactor biosynthesis protein MoaE [Terriglobales bacterium]|nr:molybdenum cofactor biosynthesis protein MoaE [Terriglobales bacterium]
MQVRVLFFGVLRDLIGQSADSLNLPEHATLNDVLAHYEKRVPCLGNLSTTIAMSINQEYAKPETKLHAGDEVALLPPVSGGSSALDSSVDRIDCAKIVREKIDTSALLQKIKCPADGAAVVFEGVVRDNSRGRPTIFLDYEAYEEMAIKQMSSLIEQALSQFPVRQAAIVHRLGRLQVGETSVVVVVASAHRADAFDACRWLIDSLKRTVPIWKKEYFRDGAMWAPGQPFPAEIESPRKQPSAKPASK